MTDALVWLASMAVLPLAVVWGSYASLDVERLRRFSVWAAGVLVGLASLGLVDERLRRFALPCPALLRCGFAEPILRADVFSSLLLPFGALLWLVTLAATPRARLDRHGLRRTAWSTLTTLLAFSTTHPVLLVLLWVLSVEVFAAALEAPEHRGIQRVIRIYLGSSCVFVAAGVALLALSRGAQPYERWAVWLIVVAAMIRKGIFPFHSWVPAAFERGRLGPAVLFGAPQLGAYITAVLVVPRAQPEVLHVIAVLALLTAVYGAALTLAQRDAGRACGYLFVSQSALVMAGLDCASSESLAGALLLWLSSGIGFTALARCVLVLEARRGRLDLSVFHGGHERMPLLATSFLVLGLCCTGFPGTLGFVGEELLVHGAVHAFPVLGFAVVVAGALTGLSVLRMYFALFGGRRAEGGEQQLLPREGWAFGLVAGLLLVMGLAPGPIVSSRLRASEALISSAQDVTGNTP